MSIVFGDPSMKIEDLFSKNKSSFTVTAENKTVTEQKFELANSTKGQ